MVVTVSHTRDKTKRGICLAEEETDKSLIKKQVKERAAHVMSWALSLGKARSCLLLHDRKAAKVL